jgi:hypothetical protein
LSNSTIGTYLSILYIYIYTSTSTYLFCSSAGFQGPSQVSSAGRSAILHRRPLPLWTLSSFDHYSGQDLLCTKNLLTRLLHPPSSPSHPLVNIIVYNCIYLDILGYTLGPGPYEHRFHRHQPHLSHAITTITSYSVSLPTACIEAQQAMSQYSRLPQSLLENSRDEVIPETLQSIPSDFDVALNGPRSRYLPPTPIASPNLKSISPNLLDPVGHRRLSISPLSWAGRPRGSSPYPLPDPNSPRTWSSLLDVFWLENRSLFYVTLSQVFSSLMNVSARLLETDEKHMNPFQILFMRMSLSTVICMVWMWHKKMPNFVFGEKGVRRLLLMRAIGGFFGIFGMYSKSLSSSSARFEQETC